MFLKFLTSLGALGTTTYASHSLKKLYPPAGEELKYGTEIMSEDGKTKKVVIGYFGAESEVFKKGIDPKRGLFYGNKKTAQWYAISSSGLYGHPMVGVAVAKRRPTKNSDYTTGYFEGYDPLSKEFCVNEELELVQLESVTLENRIGLYGSAKRAYFDFQKAKSQPKRD